MRKYGKKIAAAVAVAAVVSACAATEAIGSAPVNNDPRQGWVEIFGGYRKACDLQAGVMIYEKGQGHSSVAFGVATSKCA
jgi:hypothetical protein